MPLICNQVFVVVNCFSLKKKTKTDRQKKAFQIITATCSPHACICRNKQKRLAKKKKKEQQRQRQRADLDYRAITLCTMPESGAESQQPIWQHCQKKRKMSIAFHHSAALQTA